MQGRRIQTGNRPGGGGATEACVEEACVESGHGQWREREREGEKYAEEANEDEEWEELSPRTCYLQSRQAQLGALSDSEEEEEEEEEEASPMLGPQMSRQAYMPMPESLGAPAVPLSLHSERGGGQRVVGWGGAGAGGARGGHEWGPDGGKGAGAGQVAAESRGQQRLRARGARRAGLGRVLTERERCTVDGGPGWGTITWKRGQRLASGTSAMEEGRRRPKVYKAHLCYHHMALGAARVVVVVKEQANVLERCARLVSSLLVGLVCLYSRSLLPLQ
jgi:hypothetical protein